MTPFIEEYLSVFSDTEPPKIFHLWTSISLTAAALGKNVWFNHGISTVFPNIYVMFIGHPGSRKSVSIKAGKKILRQSGYETFAPDKSTKEKFLLDFEKGFSFDTDEVAIDEPSIEAFLGGDIESESREVYIPADEWLEFFGEGNVGFATLLGTLWDYDGVYRDRLKNSKSVTVPNPVVNVLGGCTHDTFKLAFPPALLGHGFISRLILVYGERGAKKITFPKEITPETTAPLAETLQKIKHLLAGQIKIRSDGFKALDDIYQNWLELDDSRFQHYSTRRFTQLLKLCIIIAAQNLRTELWEEDVLIANTILTYTEQFMPKALGEFGANRNSGVVQKIMSILDTSDAPVDMKELWKQCSRDLEKFTDLAQIIQNLLQAEKIQRAPLPGGKHGYLPRRVVRINGVPFVNLSLIEKLFTQE